MKRYRDLIVLLLILRGETLRAQSAREMVQQATQVEIAASKSDHSLWRYRQEEKVPVQSVSIVVETAQGSVKEKIVQEGRPVSAAETAAERKRLQGFVHDPSAQEKQRRDGAHDDESAEKLLRMLPEAFLWKVTSQTSALTTLEFVPDPKFNPSGMEARVMSTMGGQLVIDRAQKRIRTIRGTLTQDVNIGYGLLGRLRQGGTFDVERRELAPGLWQITETHVHIEGRALLFKTIGQQQDEINSDYRRVPESTTLEQAVLMLSERGPAANSTSATR
jgi:hypothetical protein